MIIANNCQKARVDVQVNLYSDVKSVIVKCPLCSIDSEIFLDFTKPEKPDACCHYQGFGFYSTQEIWVDYEDLHMRPREEGA
jgi:hypothetical protein